MSILTPHISFKRRLFSSSGWAFFTMLVWECVESLLEYAIAYVISSAITLLVIKLVATFLIITATQVASKQIHRFVLTFVRKITYKQGEDKLETLKKIFKNSWDIIKSNKCSLVSIVTAVLLAVSGTGVIDVNELPAISLGKEKVVEAVVQEEPVIANEIVYGNPIFATEVVWEKEPVIATEVIWEKEPVIADKLTFIANTTIYEDDGTTIKYNVGDIVLNSEIGAYADKVDVFQVGNVITEGTILYNIGDVIIEGTVKYNVNDIIEEGTIKYNVGDYMGTEILYNVGDVIIAKGTVLEEAKTIPPFNATPYIYYILLGVVAIVVGVFFENPKDYAKRKELDKLKKEAQKEIKQEDKKAVNEKTQAVVEQEQKVAEAEKQKLEQEKRAKLEQIKAQIRAEKAN